MGYERYAMAAGILLLASAAAQAADTAASAPASSRQQVIPRDAGSWGRDPFLHRSDARGATSPPVGKPLPHLPAHEVAVQGVMRVDGRYFALVNGRVVKAGDRIDRLQVEKISRYRVVVKDDAGRRTIDIYAGETPKR
jgi:hypothetical protein